MSERIPSLNVSRQVANLAKQDLANVENHLLDDSEISQGAKSFILRLLRPAPYLHATIFSSKELLRLQERAGVTLAVDEEHIQRLRKHILSKLPASSRDGTETPTLPSRIHPVSTQAGDSLSALTIAGSQDILIERLFVKEAVRDFYEVESVPDDFWSDDERTTRVWLAKAPKDIASILLPRLTVALDYHDLLPENTEFSRVGAYPVS